VVNGSRPVTMPTEESEVVLGAPASATHAALQTDAFKELINKLAWALGSTYRTPYNNTSTPTRKLATRIAKHVLSSQGYPLKIVVVKDS